MIKKKENENELKINGVLRIHWNLKNPIRISNSYGKSESVASESSDSSVSIRSSAAEEQTNFKATTLKELNEKKQTLRDDTLLKSNTNKNDSNESLFRSHTVKCKPNKWKRTQLPSRNEVTTCAEETTEDVSVYELLYC
jgi:hypothetical protein